MGGDRAGGRSRASISPNAARATAVAVGVCALLLAGCATTGRITVHVEGMTRVLGIT